MADASLNDLTEQSNSETQVSVYVGPRPYRLGQELYGRDREAVELLRLLLSQRLVLLHSPSGAGKTSLIHARLVPALQKRRFEVPLDHSPENRVPQPISIRLNREAEECDPAAANRYLLSAMLSLELQRPESRRRPAAELVSLTLDQYLEEEFPAASRDVAEANSNAESFRPLLLLFDQFEELLTMDPTDEPVKREFVRQLGEALRNRGRWALFAIREDYLGALEPYLFAIPTGLETTYRLGLLRAEVAASVIEEPAGSAGVSYEDGVVAQLVKDLRQIRVQAADGSFQIKDGPHVEPVQLQVVCQSLWWIRGDAPQITHEHLEKLGRGQGSGVDHVLAGYYADRVAQAASEGGVSERVVRNWFGKSLIGTQRVRRPVLVSEALGFGLTLHCLKILDRAFLIRREHRSGAQWYELAHDRLMQPVLQDNALWRKKHLTTFQTQAELWVDRDRPDSLLLSGRTLAEAEEEAEASEESLTAFEKDFLDASRKVRDQETAEQARKQALLRVKILGWAMLAGSLLLVLVSSLAAFAVWQERQAVEQKEIADHLVYAGQIGLAKRHLAEGNVLLAEMMLDHTNPEFRGWAYRYLNARINRNQNTFAGHEASVKDACFLGGETRIVTASDDSTLKIWDTATRRPLSTLAGHSDWVNCLAVTTDGKWIVSGSDDNTVRVWDAEKKTTVHVLEGHTDCVDAVAIDPQDRWIVSGSQDGTLMRWDLKSGSLLNTMESHQGPVLCVAFSPDGRWIISGSTDQTIKRWETEGNLIETFKAHDRPVTCLAVSPDGKWFASGSMDKSVKIWASHKGAKQTPWTFQELEQPVSGLALKVDGEETLIAVGDRHGVLTEWEAGPLIAILNDLAENKAINASSTAKTWQSFAHRPRMHFQAHSGVLTSLAYSPLDRRILSSSTDNSARIWDGPPPDSFVEIADHEGAVWDVDLDPKGEWIVTAGQDATLRIHRWRDPDAEPLILRGHDDAVWRVAVSPDGQRIASGSEDRTIIIWDSATGKQRFKLTGHKAEVTGLVYSRDPRGQWIVSCSHDKTIKLWDAKSGREIRTFNGHTKSVSGVDISPDGKHLISSSEDQTIRVWNVKTGALIRTFDDLDAPAWCVSFSADGKRFVSGSKDGTLQVREFPSGNITLKLSGHTAWVTTVDFSPDGRRIVSGSEHNVVKLWELAAGTAPLWLTDHHDTVWRVRFSDDGHRIVSASEDWTVKIWDATSAPKD